MVIRSINMAALCLTTTMQDVVLSWSGGKDSTLALWELSRGPNTVVELLTTISASTGRSNMHGIRRDLLQAQAAALGVPITILELPDDPSNEEYAAIMNAQMDRYSDRGIDAVAFGDIYLDDVRQFREDRLEDVSIQSLWPIWGRDTDGLIEMFLDAGFRAVIVAARADHFDESVVGSELDDAFLASLPDGVDPAGENGEFHTFVVDGPLFDETVAFARGTRVTRDVGLDTTMHYCDLVLTAS